MQTLNSTQPPKILLLNCLAKSNDALEKALINQGIGFEVCSDVKTAQSLLAEQIYTCVFISTSRDQLRDSNWRKVLSLESTLFNKQRLPCVAVVYGANKETLQLALMNGLDDCLDPLNPVKTCPAWLKRWFPNVLNANAKEHNLRTEKIQIQAPLVPIPRAKKVVEIQKSLELSNGNPDLAKEMLSLLIQLVTDERKTLIHSCQHYAWSDLGERVHKIHGGCCYCGVPDLQQWASSLDLAIDKGHVDVALHLFEPFIQAIDALIEWDKEHDMEVIFS